MKNLITIMFVILLSNVVNAQTEVETAIFDKAVKKHFKEWKGYANMHENERAKILKKIDSLDLSNNALLRLPKEIAECPNLKHINLLGNKNIDWKDCFEKVKTTRIISVYVSVNDLSDIDSVFWKLVTGIELLGEMIKEFPKNILQQKHLKYLEIPIIGEIHN